MRILLLSDIHANLVALDTVLQSAPSHDRVWCLGDVVGYGPAPNECCARLRELDALCLAGNHDWAVLGRLKLGEFNDYARFALQWTRQQLSEEQRAWLAALPSELVMLEHDLTLVHASPRQPVWEYIENSLIAAENMDYFTTAVCLFGHTHRPIAYQLRAAERVLAARMLPEQLPLRLQPKLLLNPGSVGQPRDRDPRAAYALLDLDARTLTHYRVEYDLAATQRAMLEAGLPARLVTRLAYGA